MSGKIIAITICMLISTASAAQTAAAQNQSVESGEAGARAGTLIYNANAKAPLPVTGGNVLQNTATNLGGGQTLKQAWSNAAASNAGLPTPTPSPTADGTTVTAPK